MKIKKRQILPILVIGGVAASCYGVINYINNPKSSFAAEKKGIISVSVENYPDVVDRRADPTLNLTINTDGQVASGDHLRFCTYGFGFITGSDLSISSGEVVGRVVRESGGKNPINIQRDLSDNSATRLELDKGGYENCYRVTFNDNAAKYDRVSGVKISSRASTFFVQSNIDYPYRAKVTYSDGTEIYGKNITVKSTSLEEKINANRAKVINGYRLSSADGAITGLFLPGIEMPEGSTLPVGSTIKYSLANSGFEYFNSLFKAGQEIVFRRDIYDPYRGVDSVNNNNVYVYQNLGDKRFKVISHTSEELIIESLSEIDGGMKYELSGFNDTNVRLIDPSKLTEGSNTIDNIVTRGVIIDGKTSVEIYNNTFTSSLNYSGQSISPGDANLRRGTVLAKYVDEAGREISNQKTVSNNQPFGTQYNDTEIQITGYTFSRLGAGSAPKQGTVNGSTQTITYVYTQQRGTVLAKYVDEAGREISNQKTVSNNQPFGTRYTVANPDKISGYRYVGLAPNSAPQNGTVNGGTQTIIFKFEKIQVTPKTQTIKVGETPDPKVHIPNFDQDFAGCKVEYKEPVDSSAPGVVDVKLIISCPGQENREVDSKVYVVGGNDISVPVGKILNPKDHITDFDEKFPGCEVRYKNKVDTTKVGTVDATIIISCPGEDEKEVDVKIHITPVPTVPQTIKVGETPDPKVHIPNFEEHFPGCDARYKTQPDTSRAGRIDVIIVVTCDDAEIEIHSHLIIEELPAQVKAPNTGSASGILPAAIATISAIVSATAIFFKKK